MIGSSLALTMGGGVIGGEFPGPVNTVAPVVTNGGTGELGDTLTCTSGTWTTDGTISGYVYQWYRAGSQLSGETANTYVLVEADDDIALRCRVTATDEFGSKPRFSNTVGPYDLVTSGTYNDGNLTYSGDTLTYGGDYLTFNS